MVGPGMVLCQPGAVVPASRFAAEVYVLTKSEGGRSVPFVNGFRPTFYFRTTDITGEIELPDGREMVMPGDNVTMDVELVGTVPVNKGLRFAVREGGRTVGAGIVTGVKPQGRRN